MCVTNISTYFIYNLCLMDVCYKNLHRKIHDLLKLHITTKYRSKDFNVMKMTSRGK